MSEYLTGLILDDIESEPLSICGLNWIGKTQVVRRDGQRSINELVIESDTIAQAQCGLDLICALLWLLHGEPLEPIDGLWVCPAVSDGGDRWHLDTQAPANCGCSHRTSVGLIAESLHLAARCSSMPDLEYAVHLAHRAQRLHSNYQVDLDAGYWPYEHRSLRPYDHVRFGYSLIASYAAIEQLELEVRPVRDAESRRAFHENRWVKIARDDLCNRLRARGIAPDTRILWERRGQPGYIEGQKRLDAFEHHLFSGDDPEVRDGYMNIADAIGCLQWLRNSISAHRVKADALGDISVHDVSNAHGLVRHILLTCLQSPPSVDTRASE